MRVSALWTRLGHLAIQYVVEFPCGTTLGLPARIEGKPAVRAHLSAVQAGGLTVHDPRVQQVTDTACQVRFVAPERMGSATPHRL